jgi:hypothetical protein
MPHLYTDRPHIGVTLSGHEEMLQDLNEAVEFWHANRSPSVRECVQFCSLFVEV